MKSYNAVFILVSLLLFKLLLFIHARPEHSEKILFSKDIVPDRASERHFRGSFLKKDALASDDDNLKQDNIPASSPVGNIHTPATETLTDVGMSSEERQAAVRFMYDRIKEPEIVKRRRLGNSNTKETIAEIMDAWQYHFEINKQAHYLRSIGVTEKDGLPRRLKDSTLTHDTMTESTKIAMYLKDLYLEEEKRKEEEPKLSNKEIHSRKLKAEKAEKEFVKKLNKNRTIPKYLNKNKDGSHEINIGGGYVHSSNKQKRNLQDASLGALGGTCTDMPYGVRYCDRTTPKVDKVEKLSDNPCTCDSAGVQNPKDSMISSAITINAKEKWCKCTESDSFTTYYSYVAPKCTSYPALSSSSKCTINTVTFPKTIDCAYELVLAHGFYITLGSQFSVGYGSTGSSSDMIAEFRFGLKTNGIPRSCFESDNTALGFPKVGTNGDRICITMKFIADKVIAMNGNDIAEAMGGPSMKETMKYYPFNIAYPKTYEGAVGATDKMKLLARIPLKLAKNAAEVGSASTKGIDFTQPICISTLGSKLRQGGGVKKQIQFAGAVLAVLGTDFCFEMPGFSTSGEDLTFGLKITGTAFDKERVSLTKFTEILPTAWDSMAKDLAGKGIKDLMEDAFNLAPLSKCGNPCSALSIAGTTADKLSLNTLFQAAIVANFPAKMTLAIDIGEIVGNVASSIMKGTSGDDKKLFKLPKMFAASRRRRLAIDDVLSSQDSYKIEIPEGKLDKSHLVGRHLAADAAYAFPTNAYVLAGSRCQFTYTGMPKKINCLLKLQAGPKVTLESSAEVAVAYAIDGENLEIVSKMGFGIDLGKLEDMPTAVQNVATKLNAIDIGGFIDDSLSQTIKIAPFSINFPAGYKTDPTKLFEVARVPVSTIKTSGMCLSNMETLAPDEMKDAAAAIAGAMGKVTGPVGGDVCGQVDKIDLTKGFSTNVDVELKLFDKSIVDVYPIIQTLATLEPSVKTLLNLIDAVFGSALKTEINDGVKAVFPDEQNFRVSMGMLIAQALKKAPAGAKAMAGAKLPSGALRRLTDTTESEIVSKHGRRLSRRRLAAELVFADGSFNLGGIPKSSKPGSTNKGDPSAKVTAETSTSSTSTTSGGGTKTGGTTSTSASGSAVSTSLGGGFIFLIVLAVLVVLCIVGWTGYRKTNDLPLKPEKHEIEMVRGKIMKIVKSNIEEGEEAEDEDAEEEAKAELKKLKKEKKALDKVVKAKLENLNATAAAAANRPKKNSIVSLPSNDPFMKRLNEIKKEMKIVKNKIEEGDEAEDEDAEEEAEAELKKIKNKKEALDKVVKAKLEELKKKATEDEEAIAAVEEIELEEGVNDGDDTGTTFELPNASRKSRKSKSARV